MSDVTQALTAALSDRYALDRELGAGGMATVYLASDLRHHRKVALKVLKPELAAVLGPERFLSEIRTTAKLQHPHLLPLFDSGEAEGLLFYVMPYVQGESLRQRLERERQLPVEEAVRIGAAMASALDYAHRHGVIHRDLKPENVLLHEGQPLVADFGIALAVSVAGGARITQTGLSLGTPAYMSPEQATGDRVIDARSDLYSLGALTYEMLAGDPPHVASTSQAVIAKLLTERPQSLRVLRPSVPGHVDLGVLKALERLPADRFASAGEFAEAITGVRPVVITEPRGSAGAAPEVIPRPRLREMLPWVGGTAIVTAAVGLALVATFWPGPSPVVRFTATPPAGEVVGSATVNDPDVAISTDGRRIVYVGRAGGQQRLYVRALDELTATPLAGTEGARTPFFSPDGRWIGYIDPTNGLRKIPAAGGTPAPVTVGQVAGGLRGASWGPDDWIVFATVAETGLLRAPAAGGEPEVLTTPDRARGEVDHWLPEVLPSGRAVLFTAITAGGTRIEALDLGSGERKVLVEGGSQPRYAASGHLLYAVQGTLQAVAFDAERLEVVGEAIRVIDGIVTKSGGAANYSLSASGVLVYHAGNQPLGQRTLVWVDRQGREEALGAPPRGYVNAGLSADGSRVALSASDQEQDIWVWDLGRRTLTRLTFGPALDNFPVWMPDSRRIVFASQREGPQNLYAQAADGTGSVERLTDGAEPKLPYGFRPDGSELIFRQVNPGTAGDLHVLRLTKGRGSDPLITTPFDESNAALSPDGRWLAYQSNESGRAEVYVRPFPEVNTGRWQVSAAGGTQPMWARDGRELFYAAADGRLTAVAVEPDATTFASGTPASLLEPAYFIAGSGPAYGVSPDGRRFLMLKEAEAEEGAAPAQLVVVLNWFAELKQLAPAR